MKISKQLHKYVNTLNAMSKTLKITFGTLLTLALLSSCNPNDDGEPNYVSSNTPTSQEFESIREQALENVTQSFQFNADDGNINLTSNNGVSISINGNCLTKNGNPVTGIVDLEYIELFQKGHMLTTNKPTMGIMPGGEKALLISGGEFFLEATQDGVTLETNCPLQLLVPASLTGTPDNNMILWTGFIDENGDLAWDEMDNGPDGQGENGVFTEGSQYYAFFGAFGWTNIDKFYNDPRPKTTIKAAVPEGYDNTNSAIYLSYDGEDSGLAHLDSYDPIDELFSEHYGQIPIGLECHLIFVTEEAGNWRYAIKAVTIAENDIITFSISETDIATEAELTTIINNLP
ncbi:hypothetical protein ACFSSB_09765 [Lacinutrix gracilariae]|uniref:Lipocalin-like domain-containing protein n=1 Tax=Lacinutrix gracilariae TaxID=1747198 RepID=A0ABW5K447_9FLAO